MAESQWWTQVRLKLGSETANSPSVSILSSFLLLIESSLTPAEWTGIQLEVALPNLLIAMYNNLTNFYPMGCKWTQYMQLPDHLLKD